MIINEWEPFFTEKYGHIFPNTYLCIDTEYTGGNERSDLIMEIGHVMVQDGRVIDRMNIVLDWSLHKEVDPSFVRHKIDDIRSRMGDDWRITWEVMKEEGMSPIKALRFYSKLFDIWHGRGLPFVAHNGRKAEERMLRGIFNRFIHKPFFVHENQLWDTGAIFKATRLYASEDPLHSSFRWKAIPEGTDSLKSYFERVLNARIKGIRWSLKYCLEHYGLEDKLEDTHRFHQADYDAYCSHLLMQEYRSRVTRNNSGENALESSDTFERMFEEEVAKVKVSEEKDILSKIVEEAPRQPLSPRSEPVEVTIPAPEAAEVPKQPRLQPRRGRKRGQRVI
jgi:DNA polymerase III epsilon subunit-like protein